MGAGAWKTMYSNDATDVSIAAAENSVNGFLSETETPNGHAFKASGRNKSKELAKQAKPAFAIAKLSGSEPNVRFSSALSNDNIVIIESPTKTAQHSSTKNLQRRQDSATSSIRQQQMDVYGHSGIQNNRAGPTIRSLSEAELPQPDTVRKAKDVFETLAKKRQQETHLKHQHSFAQDTVKPRNATSNIGRSQSMLVLTGRAWCNGGPLVANGHHRNGACSDAVSSGRAAFYQNGNPFSSNLTKLKIPPTYQRSCSELDKFFQIDRNDDELDGDDDSDDLWQRFVDKDRGSPVSPEVIQRIREKGTCVKFFGSEASVVGSATEDEFDDDGNVGYLLEYPYDLYRSTSSCSPNASDDSVSRKPKIIGMVPKTMSDSSLASSTSSMRQRSEILSPSPSTNNGWIIGGGCINGVSLEDIRASLTNADAMDSSRPDSSLESGYVKLKHYYDQPLNGHQIPMTMRRSHGKWMKNPYWQGSYYVIYDFTLKDIDSSPKINGF